MNVRAAWTAVVFLTLMYGMSYVDRYILAVLADPVARSLGLSDAQIGFVSGTSFALLYAFACLPMAQFVDTGNRKRIVLFGVTLWSTMTIASCFAVDLVTLMVTRSGVAIGEAVLIPAAVSMIGDLFVKERRGLPLAVFSSMATIMATASFIVSGSALALAGHIAPGLGLEPWRLTFVIVGAPGLFLALGYLLIVKEPARSAHKGETGDDVSFIAFVRYLGRYASFYGPLILAHAVQAAFAFALLSWTPTLLIRAHGLDAAEASILFGLVITPTSLAASYFWPWLAMRIERQYTHKGVPIALLVSACIALPAYILAPLFMGKYPFIIAVAVAVLAIAAWGILPNLGFQIFTPQRMRGRASALATMGATLIGYGLGPVMAVYFGEFWTGPASFAGWALEPNPLARGLSIAGMIAAPIMILCMSIAVKKAETLPMVEPAPMPADPRLVGSLA